MNPFYTTVYKDAEGFTVAEDDDGLILAQSSTAPETVIQTALDRKGDLKFLGPATHACSTGLTAAGGLKIKSNTTIYSNYDVKITVPNGYAGGALVADPTYNAGTVISTKIIGGLKVEEAGTPQRLWDGFLMKLNNGGLVSPATAGICFANFGYLYVNNAKTALAFDLTHADGWITSTKFECITVFNTVNGVEFRNTVSSTAPSISTLHVEDFWFQSGGSTAFGVKGVIGNNHTWDNASIWDLQLSGSGAGTGKSAQFMPIAQNQLVLGGILMHFNLDNQAPPGQVRWIDGHGPTPELQYIERLYQTNGSTIGGKVYTIPHGMGLTPDWVDVIPKSKDAMTSDITWSQDSTNIIVTYRGTPPPPATAGNQNNVKLQWRASVK